MAAVAAAHPDEQPEQWRDLRELEWPDDELRHRTRHMLDARQYLELDSTLDVAAISNAESAPRQTVLYDTGRLCCPARRCCRDEAVRLWVCLPVCRANIEIADFHNADQQIGRLLQYCSMYRRSTTLEGLITLFNMPSH